MEQNIALHQELTLMGRRYIVGGLIAAHGAMHALLLNTPRPDGGIGNFVTRGGDVPISSLGLGLTVIETIGPALMLLTAAGFIISALIYIRQNGGWEDALMAFTALSIVSLFLFWNDWMVMGLAISTGTMVMAICSKISEVA